MPKQSHLKKINKKKGSFTFSLRERQIQWSIQMKHATQEQHGCGPSLRMILGLDQIREGEVIAIQSTAAGVFPNTSCTGVCSYLIALIWAQGWVENNLAAVDWLAVGGSDNFPRAFFLVFN